MRTEVSNVSDQVNGLRVAFERCSYDMRILYGDVDRAMENEALRHCLEIMARTYDNNEQSSL